MDLHRAPAPEVEGHVEFTAGVGGAAFEFDDRAVDRDLQGASGALDRGARCAAAVAKRKVGIEDLGHRVFLLLRSIQGS